MKAASKKMIGLIYDKEEDLKDSEPNFLDRVIGFATYDGWDDPKTTLDNFVRKVKEYTKNEKISGVDWTEVWDHFKDPFEKTKRDAFLKEWAEIKLKNKEADFTANKQIIDIINEDMIKLVRMIALVDDYDEEWAVKFGGKQMFDFPEHFQSEVKRIYRMEIESNKISRIRWNSLFLYYKDMLKDSQKLKVKVNIEGCNVLIDKVQSNSKSEDIVERNNLVNEIESLGGNIVDDISKAHLVVGSDSITDEDLFNKINDFGIPNFYNLDGLIKYNDSPNRTNELIKLRDNSLRKGRNLNDKP